MIIKEIKLRDYNYRSRKGLSERLAKRYFEKKGYEVFRGEVILGRKTLNYYIYPNVKDKQDRMEKIMFGYLNKNLYNLRKILRMTKGIPDLFIYREFPVTIGMFVEVKLEHENVNDNQMEAMSFLETFGFECMLLRLKRSVYREEVEMNIQENIEENKLLRNRRTLVTQEKMWKRYSKIKK